MIFNKSPDNLFNAVFNVPQGATMTIAVSIFLGEATPSNLIKTFVCAYCAGVMLTLFLRVPAFGAWIAKHFPWCKSPVPTYITSNAAGGALMGIFMNFFMTFMAIGPAPFFPSAFLHTLPFAMLVSAFSSCLWIAPSSQIVKLCYGKPQKEPAK